MFVEKLSHPEILEELILDDHGNYVIQKALHYADTKTKENMLKNIIPLIPKIKEVSFGERLLSKMYATYPQLNANSNYNYKNNTNNPNNKNNNNNNKNLGNNGRGSKNTFGYYNNKNKFNENNGDDTELKE